MTTVIDSLMHWMIVKGYGGGSCLLWCIKCCEKCERNLVDRGWNITVWLTDLLDSGQCFPFGVRPMCGRSFLDGSARWSLVYSVQPRPRTSAFRHSAVLQNSSKKPIALYYRLPLFFLNFHSLSYIFFCFALGCMVVLPGNFWQPTSTVFIIDCPSSTFPS